MSKEFIKLQDQINKGDLELMIKKSLYRQDIFGVWLYWHCKTKPSALNLFGKAYYLYFVFTMDWLWLPLVIFVGVRFGWLFGVILWIAHYFMQKKVFAGIGQGFTIYDAQNNEDLFDDLWQNQFIGIVSTKKRESNIHKDGVPEIIIDPSGDDWREKIATL